MHKIVFIATVTVVALAQRSAWGVDSVSTTRSMNYSITQHDLQREDNGSLAGTFSRQSSIGRFDSSLGTLTAVSVSWSLTGEVEVGVTANGPYFPGGSGTVTGDATCSLFWDMPNANPLLDVQTRTGSHTGSIAGPPGIGASSTADLKFSKTGQLSFTDPIDLATFVGNDPLTFETTLNMNAEVLVIDPGPNFKIGPGVPSLRAIVTVKYEYVPELSSCTLVGLVFGAMMFRRSVLRRLNRRAVRDYQP